MNPSVFVCQYISSEDGRRSAPFSGNAGAILDRLDLTLSALIDECKGDDDAILEAEALFVNRGVIVLTVADDPDSPAQFTSLPIMNVPRFREFMISLTKEHTTDEK